MKNRMPVNPQNPKGLLILTGAGMLGALVLAGLIAAYGVNQGVDSVTMPVVGRTLNQFMAVVLTCIALIVPLTANLYTPKLVTLYVRHPLIVAMLSLLLTSHIICLSLNFIPAGSLLNRVLVDALALIYLLVMLGALPFLYGISRFLRPSYFMPMLTRKGYRNLKELARGRRIEANKDELFETVDVVTNVALTGMARGDRQLVLLSLKSLHTLLGDIIRCVGTEASYWRASRPWFVPGLAKEGQEYLTRELIWPEAYILAQTLKVSEVANRRQHELLSEMAAHLVDTARLANDAGEEGVVELHVMTLNTLLREALEQKDLRRFQNLSYHYRLLIQAFDATPERMHGTVRHLMHYARLASRQGPAFAYETVVYDLGELVISIAADNEDRAVELIQAWAGPVWQEALAQDSGMKKVGWRTLLRAHWELRSQGFKEASDAIYWRFLTDEAIHREQLELLLEENRELHYEFNDRLMRFAHFSPQAGREAQAFLEQW
ncbi:MAG: hypothetical protein HY014_03725 [Acidobacteria bacterium]|nr:hypothetical protein [Acidobacteriota bacterium]MBI3487262.1 hypothetical protein [Acidobacteriota bacterium]